MKIQRKHLFIILSFLFFSSCSSIDVFNQKAYEQATSIKASALLLMDKATEQYSTHLQEIEGLKLDVEKAYEYAKGRPKNEESTKQWEIIKDPNRNSLMGFIKRWQSENQLSAAFIREAKKIISDDFDTIIDLESGKRKK